MSLAPSSSLDAFSGLAQFSEAALRFAEAWSEVAPGRGGWTVTLGLMEDRSVLSVAPPGCEVPAFYVSLVDGVVVLERQRPAEVGGAFVAEGQFCSLEEALLDLCPLSDEQLEGLEARLLDKLHGGRAKASAGASHYIH